MLKLKQKLQSYKKVFAWAAAGLVLVLPIGARAVNFDNGSITFTIGTESPSGKPDNWIRAVDGEPINFTVQLSIDKLTDAASSNVNQVNTLQIGTDTFDLHTSVSGRWTISEMGVGIDLVGSGNACTITTVLNGVILGDTAKIMTCDFKGRKYKINTNPVVVGNKVSINVSLPASAKVDLNLTRPCPREGVSTQAGCFAIYPYMTLAGSVRFDKDFALNTVAKDMYISFFPDASSAAAAQRPPGIPGYGERTGSPDADASGSYLLGFINKILMFLLGLVNEIVFFLFYWLIAPLIQALLSIHTYKDNFVNVIYPGWEVVRNVCNIFFIIAIIGIALATLFRLEGYQYRHLLVQLILAALLVNFSLVIAQAILALADTIQNQFLPNNIEVIRSLARDLMVANTRDAVLNLDVAKYGQFSYTVISFFWVSLSVGSFAVFAGLCAYLVIRVVMLWVLLMVSPIAFVGGILPSTAGLRNQWWEYFLKYAFFTPIMAFMLNMTAIISNSVRQNTFLQKLTSADFSDSNVGSLNVFIFKVGGNLMILVFLMVAIKVAEEMGIYGASAISEIANKGVMMPLQLGGKGAKWAVTRSAEAVQNKTGVNLNPMDWAKAFSENFARKKHERLEARMQKTTRLPFGLGEKLGVPEMHLGSPQDMVDNYFNLAAVKRMGKNLFQGNYAQKAEQAELAKRKSELMTDRQRNEEETKNSNLKIQRDDLVNHDEIHNAKAKEIVDNLNQKIKSASNTLTDLRSQEAALRASGQTAMADGIKAKADTLDSKIKDWNEWATQIGYNAAAGRNVNMNVLRTALATRTTGRRVTMSDQDFENEIFDKDKTVADFNGKIKDSNEKIIHDDDERSKLGLKSFGATGATPIDDAFIANAKQEAINFRKEAAARKAPEAYYARQARLHGESEAMKKIDIDDIDQLTAMFQSARSQHEHVKAIGVMKKMAKDGNFNNLLVNTGYDASYEGMQKFFTEFQHEFHMADDETLQTATEVASFNEGNKVWNLARVVKVKPDGKLAWMTPEEHHEAANWEIGKQHTQNLVRTTSRLSYVNESPTGEWTFHKGGVDLLKKLDTATGVEEIRKNMNVTSLNAITGVKNWQDSLRAAGVPDRVIAALNDAKSKKGK